MHSAVGIPCVEAGEDVNAQELSKPAFPIRLGADNRHIAGKNRNVP
jgi:hypothetical protein